MVSTGYKHPSLMVKIPGLNRRTFTQFNLSMRVSRVMSTLIDRLDEVFYVSVNDNGSVFIDKTMPYLTVRWYDCGVWSNGRNNEYYRLGHFSSDLPLWRFKEEWAQTAVPMSGRQIIKYFWHEEDYAHIENI